MRSYSKIMIATLLLVGVLISPAFATSALPTALGGGLPFGGGTGLALAAAAIIAGIWIARRKR